MSKDCTPPAKLTLVYASLWLASFFSPLLYTGMNNVLPSVALEFHASAATTSLIVILFAYSQGFFGMIGGRMSDLFGLRKMMSIGFIICAVTLVGLFIAPNFIIMSICRFLQGIGTALLICCSTAIAVNVTPIFRRGAVLGVLTSAVYLGTSLGPLIAGAITSFLGWRFFFLLLLIPCVGGFFLFRYSLKVEWCTLENEKFDKKGSILLGVGIACISFGAGLLSYYFACIWLIPIGVIILIYFVYTQNHLKYPVIKLSLFKIESFSLGILAMFISFGTTASIVYFTTMYFQQVRGLTPIIAGSFFLFKTLAEFFFSPMAGKAADKVHPEYFVILSILITIVSLLMISFLGTGTNLYYIAFILFCTGLSVAVFSAPCTLSALRNVNNHEIGVASGLTGASRIMGVLAIQLVASLVITYYLGTETVHSETVPQFLSSMQTTMFFLVILNILSLIFYLRFTKHLIDEEKRQSLAETDTPKT